MSSTYSDNGQLGAEHRVATAGLDHEWVCMQSFACSYLHNHPYGTLQNPAAWMFDDGGHVAHYGGFGSKGMVPGGAVTRTL